MAFIKVVKNKSYFKRYQVKFRRRREGKTDYRARKRLVAQDKTKYNAPKYRFVVRITLKDIVAQVVAPKIKGDEVICSAYAHELPNYGLKVGLTNYAAAYCTGLLCARRLLNKFKLDKKYAGNSKVDGTAFLVEQPKSGPRPFRAALDVGLARTTTGARVFGILKGACDGGLYIPHSDEGKRFPGFKDGKYDPKVHRAKIFGQHVADYMSKMKKDDAKKYAAHFSNFIKEKVEPEQLAKLYEKVHANIRADPTLKKKTPKKIDPKDVKKRAGKKTLAKRRQDVKAKKEALIKEITKKRAEAGLLPQDEDSVGVVKVSKKDRVKQISTKKPKAPKEKGKEGGKKADAKGGKAAPGAKDAKAAPAKKK